MRISYQRGAITAEQKARLADELTHVMLIGEIGEDTPHGRPVANIIFTAVDPDTDWFIGGKIETSQPKGGRFMIDVIYPVGAAPQAAKTELHRSVNEIIARVLGVDGTFPNRAGDWVMIHEIRDGNWGASGVTVGTPEIAAFLQSKGQRAPFTKAVLDAEKRTRQAHAFPVGAGRD